MLHLPTRSRTAGRWRGVSVILATTMLAGCFLADKDAADPIIPDAALAYPMKTGVGRQCTESSDGAPVCNKAELERRLSGGYSLTVWEKSSEGMEEKGSPKLYKLRKLSGPGVPADSYLVQIIDDNPDSRFLGLLSKRADGGWEQIEPQCEKLLASRFAEFMSSGWIFTQPEATLDNVVCYIARDNLTDERLHAILSASAKSSVTVIYPRK